MGATEFMLTVSRTIIDSFVILFTEHPMFQVFLSIFIIFAVTSTLYNELVVNKQLNTKS